MIKSQLPLPLRECPIEEVKVSFGVVLLRIKTRRTLSAFLLQSHSVTCFHITDNTATAFKPNVWCLQPARSILQHHYRIGLSLLSLIKRIKKCSKGAKLRTCLIWNGKYYDKIAFVSWKKTIKQYLNLTGNNKFIFGYLCGLILL